jgi:hypothetical protein
VRNKNHLQFYSRLSLVTWITLAVFNSACSRATSDESTIVNFKTPTMAALKLSTAQSISKQRITKAEALPTDRKICFAINVTGPGIETQPVKCLGSVGQVAGFTGENSELSLVLPRGNDRNFELLIFLADPDKSCPTLTTDIINSSFLNRTFISGSAKNISLTKDSETVNILLNFPGLQNSMAKDASIGTCLASGRLKGTLFSNGDASDANGNLTSESSPLNAAFYMANFANIWSLSYLTSSGELNTGSGSVSEIPPYVFSVTRKPDSGLLYGLLHDGQIVEINISSTPTLVTVPLACPFSVAACKVPVWMQSISAGAGDELFGLDHGGMIYRLDALGATPTDVSVGATATQVSYY